MEEIKRTARAMHVAGGDAVDGEFDRTGTARVDLLQIWTYIANDNFSAADRMLDRIDATCHLLAQQPLMGQSRPELAQSYAVFLLVIM